MVFPNPTHDAVQVLLPSTASQSTPAALHLTDLQGRVVSSTSIPPFYTNKSISIATTDLANGTYLVSYIADGTTLASAKVVVQH